MIIIGCDFHPSFQQIAMLDTGTGATEEHKLMHTSGEAERAIFWAEAGLAAPWGRRDHGGGGRAYQNVRRIHPDSGRPAADRRVRRQSTRSRWPCPTFSLPIRVRPVQSRFATH